MLSARIGAKRRRQSAAQTIGVEDQVRDLLRTFRDTRTPTRKMGLAGVLALVVKTFAVAVDDDAVRDRGDAGDDAAVKFRAARIDRDHVGARGIAGRFDTGVE